MRAARRPAAIFGDDLEQYLEAKIALALTFARLVRTEQAFGQTVAAQQLAHKAAQAHVEAAARVQEFGRHGSRLKTLRARLALLGAELARLDQE